jgi:glycosyltransferase involved in cell wall biosynthesis
VDVEVYHSDTNAREQVLHEFGLPSSTPLVGIVGRCHPMKDLGTFLRAAARVVPANPGVAFVLVGRGIADDAELARLAREIGDGAPVIMTGERADVPRLLAAFDVAVLSSYSEGFPNVVIEAMACGTPTVVTDVGDAAWIVGDTGVVCPPRSPDLLAQGITRVLALSRDERRALGERARQRVVANFTLPEVAARYVSLYERISRGSSSCAASQAS